jgi:protein-L-isoaspartate(D-aspartate) O-methyltransferase
VDSLVSRLKRYGYIRSAAVERAMLKVDRTLFVPEGAKTYAYNDHPLEIGYGQTISAPHMVAIMLELLEIGEKDRVLEIGTGSGYNAALIACMAKEVYTIESVPELAEIAKKNLSGFKNVTVIVRDGSLGYEEKAPYDAICVTCAAPALPETLKTQVKEGGRIVIPVGSLYIQTLYRFIKQKSSFEKSAHGEVVFVPMRGKYGF